MQAYFRTAQPNLHDVVVDCLDALARIDPSRALTVHVMIFSFTHRVIADALLGLARRRPSTRIRVLADWSQRGHYPSVVPQLIAEAPSNVEFRFLRDQPYFFDENRDRLRWSYHLSHGFLHHKTISAVIDGEPHLLVCGSANWTNKARKAFENVLVLTGDFTEEAAVIGRFELEFDALWTSGARSLSTDQAEAYYQALRRALKGSRVPTPATYPGGESTLGALDMKWAPSTPAPEEISRVSRAVAFSARPIRGAQRFGYAEQNHRRRALVAGPNGRNKNRPLSITALGLVPFFEARPRKKILMAMYGLSTRVAEYGALLDAARRGVHIEVLLDERVAGSVALRLREVSEAESLPIKVKTLRRMMHQKYIIYPAGNLVVSGTANMSVDASLRHTEHRLLVRDDAEVTNAFALDFETMWQKAGG